MSQKQKKHFAWRLKRIMRPLNHHTKNILGLVVVVLSAFGCSSSGYDSYEYEDDLLHDQPGSFDDAPAAEDTETDGTIPGEKFSDEESFDTEQDTEGVATNILDGRGVSATFDTVESIDKTSPNDGQNEDKTDGCPLNSGYPCACNTTVCDDGSDCLAYGDSLMGFCSRNCGLSGGRYTCDTSSYGLSESSSGACAVTAQPESRAPDHCAVVCRQGDLVGECPPHLVCTPAKGVDLHYCLPPGRNGPE